MGKISLNVVILSGSHFDQQKGGSEYQLLLLGKYLVHKAHRVYYIFRNKSQVNKSYGIINLSYKANKIINSLFGGSFFPYVFKVWFLLNRLKPQILIVRPGNALVGIAAIYCHFHKTKMVWHIAGKYDVEKFKWSAHPRIITQWIERQIFNFGIHHADFIIGQAKYQDVLLYQNFKRKCDIVIPNFHPTDNIHFNKNYAVINILWVANYKKNKQPEVFIKLAKDMKGYSSVKFFMIGRFQNERLVRAINETDNLKHLGEFSTNQVLELMKKSHILINTSVSEGYPNTFIQAWLNKMVVLSLHVNPDNVLTDNSIGYETKSYENLLITLKEVVDNVDIIGRKGELAYEFALKKHSLRNLHTYEKFILKHFQ